MIYPSDFESKLGFDLIREKIKGYCINEPGRKKVEKIRFQTDHQLIKKLLYQNREFKSIRERGESFPLQNYYDPTEHLKIATLEGSFIEGTSFIEIAVSLDTVNACVDFIRKGVDHNPLLFQMADPIRVPGELSKSVYSKIDEKGAIKDNASPELQKVRRRLRDEEHKARRLIDQLFKEAVANKMVPEGSSPVIRDGRVVIPVLAEYKRRVKGVIMDESATGQTVFMEPTEVLEANNEIRNLELEERRECIKILRDLTDILRLHLLEVQKAFDLLAWLDLIQAKTKLAIEIEADLPQVSDQPRLNWINARHPILYINHKGKDPVVPLNINLSTEDRFLLVSGPNAGGKSVCLKSVGLIQYMLQCGLLVPMEERSEVGIFSHLFLDIGDQQSIENDLSTYSSHLRNMRYFVEKSDANTLVLMDELGAGTDPNFGGGIAEAILKTLVAKKVWGVATTHYYNLKLFADHHQGIRNAAMLFDSKKLEPLYALEIGKPGSSFALEIARKTGLSSEILEDARSIVGSDLAGLENLIKKVNDERQELNKKERELRQKEIKYNELLNKYNQLSTELESKQKQIINKAKEEAATLLKQTNREIEKTIRHIKENKAEKKETRKVRESLQGLEKTLKPLTSEKLSVNEPVKEGDYARIEGQEVIGKIVSIKGKSAVVQFGDMRSSVKLDKLVKSTAGEAKASRSSLRSMGIDVLSKQSNFNSTLDVRGKRAEEIIPVLDQFLDDAVLLGHHELRILHGKGEGVLRQIIRDRLKQNRSVETFKDEHVERGGAGITVIVLK